MIALAIAACLAQGFTVEPVGKIDPATVKAVERHLTTGYAAVEKYFGGRFKNKFPVKIFAHRDDLDRFMQERWHAPKSEKWMVAAGTSSVMIILAPDAWTKEAAGHDPADEARTSALVTHELVHVYHGQHCPKPEFDGMDEAAWFIEGLATFASGQMQLAHAQRASQATREGKWPMRLAETWSGPYRYAVSGSIVGYIDRKYGRRAIAALLSETSTAAMLKRLKATEKDLLEQARLAADREPGIFVQGESLARLR